MPPFRDYIDPGGKIARRLGQLCATLESLGARLRGSLANAIGTTIGTVVRDTALRVLDDVSDDLTESGERYRSSWGSQDRYDERRQDEFERDQNYLQDDEEDYVPASAMEEADLSSTPVRLPAALSAGLQAASWWLRRWPGRCRMATTALVGLMATGVAYLGGPLAAAMVILLGLASQVPTITSASRSAASAYHRYH
jgi:hypothetical protein